MSYGFDRRALAGVVLLVGLWTGAAGAQAATVIYDEAVSGNLPSFDAATQFHGPFLPLSPGANIVRGTANWDPDAPRDLDWIGMTVPDGVSIQSIRATATKTVPESRLSQVGVQLFSCGETSCYDGVLAERYLPTDGGQRAVYMHTGPLKTGNYAMVVWPYLVGSGKSAADYSVELSVAAVPLPAGIGLALLAVATLAGVGLRRRSATARS